MQAIRSVPFSGLKVFIARMICHPAIGRLVGMSFGNRIPTHGLTIDTHDPVVQPKTKAELFWGIYEKAEVAYIQKYVTRGSTVLELGSSLGVTSCVIGKVIGARGRLIAIEANPELIPVCRKNLEMNIPEARAFLANRAIDYCGMNPIWLNFGNDNTSARTQAASGGGRRGAWVATSTLAGLIDEHQLNDFVLVCDIEGAEYGILTKDGEALSRCRLAIVELHAAESDDHRRVDPAHMVELFVGRHGFSVRDQRGPVFVFEKRSPAGTGSSAEVPR